MNRNWELKDAILRHMWQLKPGKDGEGVESIRQRLNGRQSGPDSLYARIKSKIQRAEDTCQWLRSYLTEFMASDEKFFTITGDVGSGKTMLARSVRERLQRSLNDEEYFTVYDTFRE